MDKDELFKIVMRDIVLAGRTGVKLKILQSLEVSDKSYYSLARLCSKASASAVRYYTEGRVNGEYGLIQLGLVEKKFTNQKKSMYVFRITKLGKEVLEMVSK